MSRLLWTISAPPWAPGTRWSSGGRIREGQPAPSGPEPQAPRGRTPPQPTERWLRGRVQRRRVARWRVGDGFVERKIKHRGRVQGKLRNLQAAARPRTQSRVTSSFSQRGPSAGRELRGGISPPLSALGLGLVLSKVEAAPRAHSRETCPIAPGDSASSSQPLQCRVPAARTPQGQGEPPPTGRPRGGHRPRTPRPPFRLPSVGRWPA